MAFNFGAFVGGMSRQVSENIESAKEFEREKQFRLDMLAEEEATKMRLARASERRAQRRQDQQNAALLKTMGYSDAKAAWIMKGGAAAVSQYVDYAEKATAKGIDPNTMLSSGIFQDDHNDPRNEAAIAATVGQPRTGDTVARDLDVMTSVLGEVEEPKEPKQYPSLEAGYAGTFSLIQIAKANGDDKEVARLEGVLNEWEQQIIAEAKRNEEEPTPDKLFNDDSRARIKSDAYRDAYRDQEFQTDINGTIVSKLEGREGQAIIARMNAADSIISQAQIKDDDGNIAATDNRLLNDGQRILETAKRNLTTYGQGVAAAEPTDSNRFKYIKNEAGDDGKYKPISVNAAIANANRGRYKTGDVIIIAKKDPATNVIVQKVYVYTNRKDLEDEGVEIQGTVYYNMFHDAGVYN